METHRDSAKARLLLTGYTKMTARIYNPQTDRHTDTQMDAIPALALQSFSLVLLYTAVISKDRLLNVKYCMFLSPPSLIVFPGPCWAIDYTVHNPAALGINGKTPIVFRIQGLYDFFEVHYILQATEFKIPDWKDLPLTSSCEMFYLQNEKAFGNCRMVLICGIKRNQC